MFEVEKIWEAVRREGSNSGAITTFVRLGTGHYLGSVDEMMAELYPIVRTRWICFTGEDTTRVGMGALVRGLRELKLSVEIVCTGKYSEPSWFNSAELWCVDYTPNGNFDYNVLRPRDSLRLKVPEALSVNEVPEISESFSLCTAVRAISLAPRTGPDMGYKGDLGSKSPSVLDDAEIISSLRSLDRVRVGLRQD